MTAGTKTTKLKSIAGEARRLIETQLDAGEELVALREAATAEGFDWSQLKSLLTAQIKDERDDGDGKRVRKLVERAEFACAYADMLGFDERKRESRSFSASDIEPPAVARSRRSKARLSESMADAAEQAHEMADIGLISHEAAAETARITDLVATKLGDGPVSRPPSPDYDIGEIPEAYRRVPA